MGSTHSTPHSTLYTNTPASILRSTRYPLPNPLLDFDPRKQIPPWVPRDRPDPHARFLEGVGSESHKRKKEKGRKLKNREGGIYKGDERIFNKEENEGMVIGLEDESSSSSADNARYVDDSSNEADEEEGSEEERPVEKQNMQSSEMWFRERYFERRQWAEERDRQMVEHRNPYEQTGYAAGGRSYYEMRCAEIQWTRGGGGGGRLRRR